MKKISILNGQLFDPTTKQIKPHDLYLADGEIISIDQKPADFQADQMLDVQNCIISPAFIDFYTYLREPGAEHKATIQSEINAAVAQGITTLCCSPATSPIADTPAVIKLMMRRAEMTQKARIMVHGALTQGLKGEQITEMASLQQAGCQTITNDYQSLRNNLVLRRALEYAATFNLLTIIRPQDSALANQGCAHEGAVNTHLGLKGIPEAAETVAIATVLALIELTGAKVHFQGISCAASVRLLENAKKQRLPVSASVNIHQLHLTEHDIENFNSECHVYPPLRSYEDRQALRQAVAEGIIDIICSDHQPHELDAKKAPFPATEAGISGLETLLPLTLKLVEENVLTLPQALACLTVNPAQLLGLDCLIKQNTKANLAIFNIEARQQINPDQFLSQGKNNPFQHWEVPFQNRYTFFNGELVY